MPGATTTRPTASTTRGRSSGVLQQHRRARLPRHRRQLHPNRRARRNHYAANGINNAGQIVGEILVGSATGDPHFTTYDGVHYDYQGVGDFLLTRSTVPGDQFDVQVRTRSYNDGTVTIMSEAAAQLCNHRVSFDVDRAGTGGSFVWLDGSPSSLNASSVLNLGACNIDELSPEHYRVAWDTGEVLDVVNVAGSFGSYLDLSSLLSWIDTLGSMEGLLSSDLNPDAWRMTDAASLLNDVPEPGTFTLLGIGLAGLGVIRRRTIFRSGKGDSVRRLLTGKAARADVTAGSSTRSAICELIHRQKCEHRAADGRPDRVTDAPPSVITRSTKRKMLTTSIPRGSLSRRIRINRLEHQQVMTRCGPRS